MLNRWFAGMALVGAMVLGSLSTQAQAAEPQVRCCGQMVAQANFRAPRAKYSRSVVGKVRRMKFRDGLNVIDRNRAGVKLAVVARRGKFVKYVMLDPKGKEIPAKITSQQNADGETICWKCGKGDDGNIHCWQIDCPVIVSNGGSNDE